MKCILVVSSSLDHSLLHANSSILIRFVVSIPFFSFTFELLQLELVPYMCMCECERIRY